MKYKLIKDPIYRSNLHVIANCTDEERDKKFSKLLEGYKKTDTKGFKATCAKHDYDDGCRDYWIHFKETNSKDAETFYMVVHEASHFVDYIFEDRGVKMDDTEARAYFLEYIVKEIWKFIGKKGGK